MMPPVTKSSQDIIFQPWHGGPCPLCPQEIVTVNTQGGEERTGLAKDFQWEWKATLCVSVYPTPPYMKKVWQRNVVGFSPLGTCQKLTGASCQPAQPESKAQLTLAGKIAIGLVGGFALYGLASLLGVLK